MNNTFDVMTEARAYWLSRVILTAAELNLFTHLEASGTVPELCKRLDLDLRAATRLLDCLVAFGLLVKTDGRYRINEASARLAAGHPESILPMVLHLNHLWDSWSDLTEIVRTGKASKERKVTRKNPKQQEAFIGAMHVVGRDLSREVAGNYSSSSFRRFLDVGGGSGTYTIAFLRENTNMRAVLFDMADVIPMAEQRLRSEGLLDRVELVAGDFYSQALPSGCDLALLSAIIHQNSPQENIALYRKVHRALVPGGALLVRDHVMDLSRTNPPTGALFALNMLVNTPAGDTYTFSEIKEHLEWAGFVDARQVRPSGVRMDGLVEARKPRTARAPGRRNKHQGRVIRGRY